MLKLTKAQWALAQCGRRVYKDGYNVAVKTAPGNPDIVPQGWTCVTLSRGDQLISHRWIPTDRASVENLNWTLMADEDIFLDWAETWYETAKAAAA